MTYVSGLDLGSLADYTAMVTLRKDKDELHVGHIHRWPLGTTYPQIVADLVEMFNVTTPLYKSSLVIDGTGVGVAVVDMVRISGIDADIKAFTITAGQKPGDGTVPKKDLVGALQVGIGMGRIKVMKGHPLSETLGKELELFRVKVTGDRNETFAAWRERDHDDLVLALALAVWHAERCTDGKEFL